MEYRKFGNTDLLVSEVGFGAWAIGGGAMIGDTAIGWGETDDKRSMEAIHASMDLGINFFDTADIYGLGHSEELLGKTIGKRKDMIIATKGGNVSRHNQFTVDYSKEHILSACEASLTRLKRDVIDYYQLHTARMNHLLQGDCILALQQLQQEGKIRYWGLSLNTFQPVPEAEWLISQGLGNGFQLVLNLINQEALPLARKAGDAGYGIIARMPLQFGLLTGKFDAGFAFDANDHRRGRITPELVRLSGEALAPIWALCEKYNCTKTQLALGYLLSLDEVSCIIPGIRTPDQARLNTEGLPRLDKEDMELIERTGQAGCRPVMDLIRQLG